MGEYVFVSLHVRTFCGIAAALLLTSSCANRGGAIHRVESGETLSEISHAYSVTIEEILAANQIYDPFHLKQGESILIPGAEKSKYIEKSKWDLAQVAPEMEKEEVDVTAVKEQPTKQPKPKAKNPEKKKKQPYVLTNVSFSWPAKGPVVFGFGLRNQRMHNGIDIRVPSGSPVWGAADGKVVYTGSGVEGYGNIIIASHGSGLFSVYAYLGDVPLKKGDSFRRGETIATADRKGATAFLHFEVRQGKKALDPLRWLPQN